MIKYKKGGEFMIIETKIAGVFVKFTGELNQTFLNRLEPYKEKITSEDFINVEYYIKDEITLPETYALIKQDNDRTRYYNSHGYYCYTDYNKQIGKYVMSTAIKNNHIIIETYNLKNEEEIAKINQALYEYKMSLPNPKEHIDAKDAKYDPDMPLINSTDQALRYVFISHGVFSVHSSAISYNGNGLIFSAPSGTGKSTHTSLWLENMENVQMINDDMPLLTIENDIIMLHGAPWAGASGINNNITVPLKAVVFLEQAKENSIEKLMTLPALQRLLREFHTPKDREMIDKVYAFLNLLLTNVPCYNLKCLPDKDAVLTVKNKIFEEE